MSKEDGNTFHLSCLRRKHQRGDEGVRKLGVGVSPRDSQRPATPWDDLPQQRGGGLSGQRHQFDAPLPLA
eukprot:CAMPEP_0184307974 /NCGR_PEP_ID=MMETSP1049-20130417/16566_1 /TAXON_ID=77928 /ORGANISM="Proteomonas sulcata, Strain CCMP704" /LENGTH=69 /DNA_ID=CAMNT_0026620579 /DNA_START=555 /DNA_END=766 /DNA_ORIENTATION=-